MPINTAGRGEVGQASPQRIQPTASYRKQLITQLRKENFDAIRFASYRTACKLRFIQKECNLHLVDLWNVIEAFRECALNGLEGSLGLELSQLQGLATNLYTQLSKRLPTSHQIDVPQSVNRLVDFLLLTFDQGGGHASVFSVKVALSSLSTGKMVDKYRYIFSQVSDSSGTMVWSRFQAYLQEALKLPAAVFEAPSFPYSETAARSCFPGSQDKGSQVTLNTFLERLLSEPAPSILAWLVLMHRMAAVENVFHPVECAFCRTQSMLGYRYKCQQCPHYELCQTCFWQGKASAPHAPDHPTKEYSSWKSPAKKVGRALKKPFRSREAPIARYPDQPEPTLDLSNLVPAPSVTYDSFDLSDKSPAKESSIASENKKLAVESGGGGGGEAAPIDDEHRLIARYTARLAAALSSAEESSDLTGGIDANKEQREMIAQLEAKNREIMREIKRLREEHAEAVRSSSLQQNPVLLAELQVLRQRKDELELRMAALQESRRELMVQLEGLMKLLKDHGNTGGSRTLPARTQLTSDDPAITSPAATRGQQRAATLPATASPPVQPGDSLMGLGGDVQQAFGQPTPRSLRNDLLVAADSVTNAMSSLVKELSEASDEDRDDDDAASGGRLMESGGNNNHQFMAALQARGRGGTNAPRRDDLELYDSYGVTTDDAESYVKTDDELRATDERQTDEEFFVKGPQEYVRQMDEDETMRTDDETPSSKHWQETVDRWMQ